MATDERRERPASIRVHFERLVEVRLDFAQLDMGIEGLACQIEEGDESLLFEEASLSGELPGQQLAPEEWANLMTLPDMATGLLEEGYEETDDRH